jgi:predicted aspartyl protease
MKTKIILKILRIDKGGYHIAVNAKINSKIALLIVDTGASRSVFDKERIKRFLNKESFTNLEELSTGLGTNSMTSQSTIIEKFEIGKLEITKYEAVLLDLSHVVTSYERIGLKPIDGVLGSDILKKYAAVIDYKKKIIVMEYKKK